MAIKWTDFLKWFARLLVLFLLPRDVQSQATKLETVRTSFASFGAIYYPHLIAKERGYYAEEGIDIEMILMPGGIATPALVAGNIHFSTSSGSALNAILRGHDLRVIYVTVDRPYYSVFTNKKEIRTAHDLKGKRFGIQSRADSHHTAVSIWLKKNGLDPVRDVSWLVVGSTEARVATLLKDHVDAVTLAPSGAFAIKAQKASVYEVVNLGREVKMLFTGLAVAKQLVNTRPDLVRRFLRATMKGREFYKSFKDETLRLTKKYDRNPDDVRSYDYDVTLEVMTRDGTEDVETQRLDIEVGSRNLGITVDVPVDRVFDFRFVREVYKEIRESNWQPTIPKAVLK